MNDFTQKEILLKLMEKVDTIKNDQTQHIEFAKGKLESIEKQAFKTNGRVNKLEDETIPAVEKSITAIQIKNENYGTKIAGMVFLIASAVSAIIVAITRQLFP